MALSRESFGQIRIAYFIGLLILVANALPMVRQYLAFIFDYQLMTNISVITVIAILTLVGVVAAYMRKIG